MEEKVKKHNSEEYNDEEFARYELNKYNDNEYDEDEYDKDEEFVKFKTIVAKQAVQVLRLSGNDINKFVSKVQKRENITQEDVDKAQNDTVAAFYMSELLSDDSKNKKRNDSKDPKNK